MRALVDPGGVPGLVLSGLAATAGALQLATIAATPIPSAQTGTGAGGITIPDSGRSSRADQVGVMASPGETVNVSPRGERPSQNIQVQIDRRVIFDVVNEGIESQDIRISADNIQGGIAV